MLLFFWISYAERVSANCLSKKFSLNVTVFGKKTKFIAKVILHSIGNRLIAKWFFGLNFHYTKTMVKKK